MQYQKGGIECATRGAVTGPPVDIQTETRLSNVVVDQHCHLYPLCVYP